MTTASLQNPVQEKITELCETILRQPEFESIRLGIDQFMINDAAQQQYQSVSERGEYLHHKQQQGVQPTEEEVAAFEKERQALINNPVARNFMEAQEEIYKFRDTIAKYVMKTFELGRVPTEEDLHEEQGGCGSGCGCH